MNSALEKLQDWFGSRTAQEQRILAWGTPVILLLVIYLLVLQPVTSAWSGRQQLLEARLDDLEWLRAQSSLVERLNTSCDPRREPLQLDRIESEITALAQRLSLMASVRRVTGEDSWLVELDSAQGNRVLVYARSLVCASLQVSSLDFTLAETGSDVGRAELRAGLALP